VKLLSLAIEMDNIDCCCSKLNRFKTRKRVKKRRDDLFPVFMQELDEAQVIAAFMQAAKRPRS